MGYSALVSRSVPRMRVVPEQIRNAELFCSEIGQVLFEAGHGKILSLSPTHIQLHMVSENGVAE